MGAWHSRRRNARLLQNQEVPPLDKSASRSPKSERYRFTLSANSSCSTLASAPVSRSGTLHSVSSQASWEASDHNISLYVEDEDEFFASADAAAKAKPSVECLLRRTSADVWNAGAYEYVKTLQSAQANHGRVDLMRSLEEGDMVAVKVMPKSWARGSHEEFMRSHPKNKEFPWLDICITRFLEEQTFPHICKPHGVYASDVSTLVVTEFGTEGDLFGLISKFGKVGREREAAVQPLARQIVDMVCLLHDLGISHGDLSPENFVVSKDGDGELRAKLIDFGMATFDRYRVGGHGKNAFLAPEAQGNVLHDTFLSDAFSLGVVLFAMVAQDYPWSSTRPGKCRAYAFVQAHGIRAFCERRRVIDDPSRCLLKAISPEIVDVVEGLAALDPKIRFHLGERCWEKEPRLLRGSVKLCSWFQTPLGQ